MTNRTFSAARLVRAMAARGFTQTSLADEIGVTRGAIGHWISGRGAPLAPTLVRLAAALSVTPDYLTDTEDAPPADLFRPAAPFRGDTMPPLDLSLYRYSAARIDL